MPSLQQIFMLVARPRLLCFACFTTCDGDYSSRVSGDRTPGVNFSLGREGNMTVFNGTSGDDILPPAGSDTSGDDTFNGGDGNDQAHGGLGKDTFDMGSGNDKAWGDDDDDYLSGGADNDQLS